MLIVILNQSTAVKDADVAMMTGAIASQIQSVALIWERAPAEVVACSDPTAVPPEARVIAIVDTIDDQPTGVLGFHGANQAGQTWGLVAAQPELANGGQVLTGDWSISSTLSHEVLEMFIDPNCNLWATDGKGSAYSLEVCDPVEAPTYTVNGVSVSNFVTPSWFDPLAPAGTHQFDKLGLLTAPFTILPGGYMTYEHAGQQQPSGQQQQPDQHHQWGQAYPGWRQTMKSGPWSRNTQRVSQVDALWHQ
jgi:hypothetical protein